MPITVAPEVKQNIAQGQAEAPEWARVVSQVLPMLFPTGATGAALAQNPAQPQPQSGWGHILTMLPLVLGGLATMRGGGNNEKLPSSLDELKQMFLERGGVESGEGTARRGVSPKEFAQGVKDPSLIPGTFEHTQATYKPGAIIPTYPGYDKVLEFQPNEGWNWQVKVQGVDKNGNPLPGERPRWHATPPTQDPQQRRK